MGVRGLRTYVEHNCNANVWISSDFRNTGVVIDGRGLYYYIHTLYHTELNFKYGGEYDQLEKKLKEFFEKLKSRNVVPYVVFDGIMARDQKKFETHKKRKKESIEWLSNFWALKKHEVVLPRLVKMIFVQVLKDMDVKHAVADFEADCEIASLANALNVPVMANDCDFCIFNIRRGYIPFQKEIFANENTTVQKFSRSGFAKHLRINPNMLPLFASLIGNDYISKGVLKRFADNVRTIPDIAQFLSEHNSVSDAIAAAKAFYPQEERLEFEEALHLSSEEYQDRPSNLRDCAVRTYNDRQLPQWVIKLYREGSIASEGLSCLCNRIIFLNTLCEKVSLPSAQKCSENLRWYYYYALADAVAPSTTEIPSQKKIGLETDPNQTPSTDQSPESQVDMDTGCVGHTLSQPEGTFGKGGKPSMISAKTEQGTHNDHALAKQPTPVTPSKLQKQSKDSSLNMATGPADRKTDDTPQATSNVSKNSDTPEDVIATEFDRKKSMLVDNEVNVTEKVSEMKIQIHDIQKMSDQEKKTHLLNMLHSDWPFIRDLLDEHQLVVPAMRYWIIHANVKPVHLDALLVHYVDEERSSTGSEFRPFHKEVVVEAVHRFSEWQDVLYWAEQLNTLLSCKFESLQVTKLYNGIRVYKVYERLRDPDIKAEDLVIHSKKNKYLNLRDAITKDLPPDCQFIQSQRSKKQQSKQGGKSMQEKKTNLYENLRDEALDENN